MDNLSVHKAQGVRKDRSRRRGTTLPAALLTDLNPIEKAWSKLKLLLRSAKSRTQEALDEALSLPLPQLTLENAEAWFRTRFGTL